MPTYDRQVPDGSLANDPSLLLSNPAQSPAGPVLSNVGGTNLVQNIVPGQASDDSLGKTMQAIFKLGGAALQPYVDQAAQEQFMTGVRRSMQGDALKDIADEQPWYTQLFGPGQEVSGARAYTVQSNLAQATAQLEAALPTWADKPGSFVQEQVQNTIKGALTGDATADALIQAEGLKLMAPLFKSHAKLAYQAQAKKANADWQVGLNTNSQLFNDRASPDKEYSVEDFGNARHALATSLEKPLGMPEETYERGIANLFLNAAAGGQFRSINELKSMGVLDALNPVYKDNILKAIRAESIRGVAQLPPELAIERAKIELAFAEVGAPEATALVTAFNRKVAGMTGITEADAIPAQSVDNLVKWGMQQQAEAYEKQRKAQTKEQNELNALNRGLSWINDTTNGLEIAIQGKLVSREEGHAALTSAWGATSSAVAQAKAAGNPAALEQAYDAQAKVLNNTFSTHSGTVQARFDGLLAGKEHNANFSDGYETFKRLNPNARAAYFKAGEIDTLSHYATLKLSGVPDRAAYELAVTAPKLLRPVDGAGKVADALRSAVIDDTALRQPSFLKGLTFGLMEPTSSELDESAIQTIAQLAAPHYSKLGYVNDSSRAQQAVALARTSIELVGNRVVVNSAEETTPLHQQIKFNAKATATAFDELLAEAATLYKTDLSDYRIFRGASDKGGSYYSVYFTTPQGVRVAGIRSEEVAKRVRSNLSPKTTPSDSSNPLGDAQ